MRMTFSILFLFLFLSSSCKAQKVSTCSPSSCGKIRNISYPFRLESDPLINCRGNLWRNLSCTNNVTTLKLNSATYTVQSIDYDELTIRLVDSDIKKDDCSSLPRNSLTEFNFTINNVHIPTPTNVITMLHITYSRNLMTFMSCENPAKSPLLVNYRSCVNDSKREYYYAMAMEYASASDIPCSCRIDFMTIASRTMNFSVPNMSLADVRSALVYGFELVWFPDQEPIDGEDIWDRFVDFFKLLHSDHYYRNAIGIFVLILIGILLSVRFALGFPILLALLIYKWKRRHLSIYNRIEEFLQSYNNLVPIRYSYSDIKKMTKGFKEKLGEGGYGCVYKGKLRSNRLVAIKILGGSKGNGEDFINEVATIGRIHHVNVVQLIGFCVEGSKRALVYDYMPNSSLDKHIFSRDGLESLSSKKMFEISLGVARGIEYLHRGCEIQILHFDIKPYNILLDENLVPKLSDFGLARLCPSNNDTVALTAARGTLGYIAPELFYKNIGGISYKADVYSFGMLLMEMASRQKNINSTAENSSQAHFPTWVSNQLSEGNEIDLGVSSEEESKLIKKMMLIALWCVQFKPTDRPSMSKVVEMLEDDRDSLQMPPTKFSFYVETKPCEVLEESSSASWSLFSGESVDDSLHGNLSDADKIQVI